VRDGAKRVRRPAAPVHFFRSSRVSLQNVLY
jgi:hypothetical protein